MTELASDVLDDPVRAALCGLQSTFGVRCGAAMRYLPEVGPFGSLPAQPSEADWADLASLIGPGDSVTLVRAGRVAPEGWSTPIVLEGRQMVASPGVVIGEADAELVTLGPADVPEVLDLVARTRPGPFGTRTIELGTYLGLRDGGHLVAMAGERMACPGWTELSAICTDPAYRGQGLAARLTRAVAAVVEARGDRPFLHVRDDNGGAIRVYERLGFVTRQRFDIYRVAPAV